MNRAKRWIFPAVFLLCAFFACGCAQGSGKASEPVTGQSFYFDTVCQIAVYASENSKEDEKAIIDGAFSLCAEYESLLSKTVEGSDIWKINHAEGEEVECDPRTVDLIRMGIEFGDLTDGRFDITIGKAQDLWDFHGEDPKVPDEEALKEAVSHVDYRMIRIDGSRVHLEDPQGEIDLGGIAKGYIADRITDYLKEKQVTSAIISLGGNIVCVGAKPAGRGKTEPFRIGVETPYSSMSRIEGALSLSDASAVTSGVYERFFTVGDKEYHHILDTGTGYPADTDILGVTITGPAGRSAECDALSTISLILGQKEAEDLLSEMSGYEAVFISRDGTVTATENSTFEKAK